MFLYFCRFSSTGTLSSFTGSSRCALFLGLCEFHMKKAITSMPRFAVNLLVREKYSCTITVLTNPRTTFHCCRRFSMHCCNTAKVSRRRTSMLTQRASSPSMRCCCLLMPHSTPPTTCANARSDEISCSSEIDAVQARGCWNNAHSSDDDDDDDDDMLRMMTTTMMMTLMLVSMCFLG